MAAPGRESHPKPAWGLPVDWESNVKAMSNDPFAGIEDQVEMPTSEARTQLLDSARRGFCPLRNTFVQWPNTAKSRPSILAKMVTNRQERALDAFLLLHALQPILEGDPLPMGTWANLLSGRHTCSVPTASKTFRTLEDMKLLSRDPSGHLKKLTLKLEDGTDQPWVKAGSDATVREGYFAIPHEYWTDGYVDRLRLPGKAMLLIALKETQGAGHTSFEMALERAQEWYGVSERTAERGFNELDKEKLLQTHIQKVANPKLPPGVTQRRYHRALREPFSTDYRQQLQSQATSRAKAAAGEKQ